MFFSSSSFVCLIQDDSYLDSYISTIGVDFVSIYLPVDFNRCYLNWSNLILIAVFRLLSENTHCGARWKDHKTSNCKPSLSLSLSLSLSPPPLLILVELYESTSSWGFIKLPNQQSKEVLCTFWLIFSFFFCLPFLFGWLLCSLKSGIMHDIKVSHWSLD